MRKKKQISIFFAGCEKELGKKVVFNYRKKYGEKLKKLGFKVNDPTLNKDIESISEKQLFKEDDALMDKSDLIVAYLPPTKNISLGTLRELKRAKRKKQIVVGFTDKDNELRLEYSPYVDAFYRNFADLKNSLDAFLSINGNVFMDKSKIHGLGIFAARNMKKGEVVINWNVRRVLNKEQLNRLPLNQKKFVSGIEGDIYFLIDGPERFVNHSCEPNAYMGKQQDVAARNIKKGEEITADYSTEYYPVKFECLCKSKNCKKNIP